MERELRRNEQEGMIGGVCAGLGEYLSIDKTWVRAFFVLSIFFSAVGIGLIGPIAYIVIWIVVPRKPYVFPDFDQKFYNTDYTVPSDNKGAYDTTGPLYEKLQQNKKQQRRSMGLVLLCIGVFLLIIQLDFISWREIFKYWPLVFIIAGLYTIFTSFTKDNDWHDPNVNQAADDVSAEGKETLNDNYSDNQNH